MKNEWILIIALSVIACISCSKDEMEEPKNNPSPTQIRGWLQDKKWVIVSNVSIDSLNNVLDLMQDVENFKLDDYFFFRPDSTYELNDNLLLRNDTATRIIDAGKWELSDDAQLLRHSDTYTTTYHPATIKEITDSTLFLETRFESDRSAIQTKYRRIE